MKLIWSSKYRIYFLIALVLTWVSAWYGIGSHHPDEYFQIFEFANYQLGNISADQLSWEFHEQMRPTIQAQLAAIFIHFFHTIGIQNPFTIAFILRALMGLLAWFVTSKIAIQLIQKEPNKKLKTSLLLLLLFLWFNPYLFSRYSSEILAMTLLLEAIYQIEFSREKYWFYIGSLLALSFFVRFQMAFAILGILMYLFYKTKTNFFSIRLFVPLFLGSLLMGLFLVLLDSSFYGNFTFTPWEYFRANILEHKAAEFGISPFYQYLIDPFLYFTPILAIFLIPLAIIGIWKNLWSIWSLIFLLFYLGHSAVGHKEFRFLFPMLIPFAVLIYFGLKEIWEKEWILKRKKMWTVFFYFLIGFNFLLLFGRSLMPAQEAFSYFQKIYDYSTEEKTIVLGFKRKPLRYAQLPIHFYKHKNTVELTAVDEMDLNHKLDSLKSDPHPIYVISFNNDDPFRGSSKLEEVYNILPSWIYHFNFNDWISRSRIWIIYRYKNNSE